MCRDGQLQAGVAAGSLSSPQGRATDSHLGSLIALIAAAQRSSRKDGMGSDVTQADSGGGAVGGGGPPNYPPPLRGDGCFPESRRSVCGAAASLSINATFSLRRLGINQRTGSEENFDAARPSEDRARLLSMFPRGKSPESFGASPTQLSGSPSSITNRQVLLRGCTLSMCGYSRVCVLEMR